MITPIVSVAAFALLFALYGLTRPRAGCGGNCGACPRGGCPLEKGMHDHA
ncbi:MAG TPA: hypothetical protein VF142_04620 [Longimicrobium sp.]